MNGRSRSKSSGTVAGGRGGVVRVISLSFGGKRQMAGVPSLAAGFILVFFMVRAKDLFLMRP
ncbi:hypothetical protein E2C01_057758 [Portunus trituberculatus]|uniref:Uncharacterized protein n=2 Tax=Portunus trituberculatus TaxID=210409 RepID=A0A5B7H3H9_PORTR|nr:hypothetical protein [Portunus trituberculatus]